jgi:GDPmannose 4,6-dehydratase
VQEFCEEAFGLLDLDWRQFVRHDPRYERPSEVDLLQGDPAQARQVLGWQPRVTFRALVRMMVEADLRLARRELAMARSEGEGQGRGEA